MLGWELLTAGFRFHHAVFATADFADDRLNPKSFAVLSFVDELRYPATIAAALSAPAPTVSNILRDLEGRGLVKREAEAGDRRRLAVRLTPLGEEVLARSTRAVEEAAERLLGPMLEGDRAALERTLHILLDALNAKGAGSDEAEATATSPTG